MSSNELTPRRGRPPRIDQGAIVAAVREIGTENVTMCAGWPSTSVSAFRGYTTM